MRTRWNVKFLAVSFLSLAILCGITFFVHGYQVTRNANQLLSRAETAREGEDWSEAIAQYRRYLGFIPNDAEVLARYGELLADPAVAKTPRDQYQALLVLEQALYRNSDRSDLRRKTAWLAMELGRFNDAQQDIKKLQQVANGPDGELESWLGRCAEEQGEYKEARICYERSISNAPALLETYDRLARLLRSRTEEVLRDRETRTEIIGKARAVIDDAVKANESSFKARLMRANFLRDFPSTDAKARATEAQVVSSDVARAREIVPHDADVILNAAEEARKSKNLDEARQLLQDGLQRQPAEWRLTQALARLELVENHRDAALALIQAGLKNSPNQVELLWALASLQAEAGNVEGTAEAVARLEKLNVPIGIRRFVEAKLDLTRGETLSATRKLEVAVPALATLAASNNEGFMVDLAQNSALMLAACFTNLGDMERARAAYERVVSRDARSVEGRAGLASSLVALGRTQEALDQYRSLMRLADAPVSGWIEVARLSLIETLKREESRRDWNEVEKTIQQAESSNPDSVAAKLLSAELLAAQGKEQAARSIILERFTDSEKRPVEAWIMLANLNLRDKRVEKALEILDDARDKLGDIAELRLARAQCFAVRTKEELRAELERLAKNRMGLAPDKVRLLLNGLAMLAMRAGEPALAGQFWQELAEAYPNNLRYATDLFSVAIDTKDDAAAASAIARIRSIEGEDGSSARFCDATLLINRALRGDRSGLSQARSILATVAASRPNWPRVLLAEARMDDIEGKTDTAIAGYQRAIDSGETDPQARRRLVELLSSRGRFSEAFEILKAAPAQVADSSSLQQIGSELAIRANDAAYSLKLADSMASANSSDFRDSLRLARLRMVAGQIDQAAKDLAKARELAPRDPEVRVSQIQFLMMARQPDRAKAEAMQLEKDLEPTPMNLLAIAQGFELAGDMEKAQKVYEASVKAAPNDPTVLQNVAMYYMRSRQSIKAEPLFHSLLEKSANLSPSATNWARRNLATALAIRGDSQALKFAPFDAASPMTSEVAADIRTRAAVLAIQANKPAQEEAIQLLERLIDSRDSLPEDYYLAAQLHESVGDWPSARRRYLRLLDLPGGDTPARLANAALALLRHSDPDTAATFVERLKARSTGSPLALELEARLQHARGQKAEAIRLATAAATAEGGNPISAAAILNDLEAYGPAEELLRKAASKSPEQGIALAQFLVNRKRYADALDICDGLWGTVPTVPLANTVLAALDVAREPRQLLRAERRLQELIVKEPEDPSLGVALGTVQNFQGRYDEAERTYRQVLAKHSKQVVALNNLAWLLTFQPGRAEEALDLLRRAAEIEGEQPGLLDTRGVAYLALGRGDAVIRALVDLEAATRSPNFENLFHLARAYEAAGRREDALQAWKKAKSMGLEASVLHPLERPAYEALARVLQP